MLQLNRLARTKRRHSRARSMHIPRSSMLVDRSRGEKKRRYVSRNDDPRPRKNSRLKENDLRWVLFKWSRASVSNVSSVSPSEDSVLLTCHLNFYLWLLRFRPIGRSTLGPAVPHSSTYCSRPRARSLYVVQKFLHRKRETIIHYSVPTLLSFDRDPCKV